MNIEETASQKSGIADMWDDKAIEITQEELTIKPIVLEPIVLEPIEIDFSINK